MCIVGGKRKKKEREREKEEKGKKERLYICNFLQK